VVEPDADMMSLYLKNGYASTRLRDKHIMKKKDNIRISVIFRRVHVTIVAVENNNYYIF